ncbi:MAG TPA: P-loop NTPase fold protein [Clostridia bacterium]|nr:P-loop NTPase fold protein [Clostridia bacterium]
MGFYFKEHDSLERRSYADFLKGLIDNCDEYRRNDEEGAYVIAIDSAWGTGKSRFFSMFENYLNGYLEEGKMNNGHEQKYNVVAYNAWDHDYWGDAMEPLMACLIKSSDFSELQSRRGAEELTQKFLTATGKVVKAAALFAGKRLLGDEAVDFVKAICEGTVEAFAESKRDGQVFAAFEERTEAYRAFKESLSQIVEKTGRRFVILIDELDRCKPTFAIQTLELAKHLFDVKGMIFVFALDVKQLSHSIRTIYGAGMDASGYLCRFFTYIGKMPLPQESKYVECLLMKESFLKDMTPIQATEFKKICTYILKVIQVFKLSLRDISTLVQNYRIMCTTFLKEYPYPAHEQYLFLLALKYKDIESFDNMFNGRMEQKAEEKYNLAQFDWLPLLLSHVRNGSQIKDIKYHYYEFFYGNEVGQILINNVYKADRSFRYSPTSQPGSQGYSKDYNEDSTWNHILYAPDIDNWDHIKEMKLSDYIFKQLEMFNFALQPSDREENLPPMLLHI